MARVLIREAHGGATREIDDRALPYFQGWVILDTLDDSTDASPLYLSKAESDFRYATKADVAQAATGDPVSVTDAAVTAAGFAKVSKTIPYSNTVANGTDFNTLTATGVYAVPYRSIATTLLNLPADGLGVGALEVLRAQSGSDNAIQRWSTFEDTANNVSGATFTRSTVNSGTTWTAWAKTLTGAALDKLNTVLVADSSSNHTVAINAALMAAASSRGRRPQVTLIGDFKVTRLVVPSGVTLDAYNATITQIAGSLDNMLVTAAHDPLRTVTDAAVTAGSATLTSATAAFTSADVGRDVYISGAGTSVGSGGLKGLYTKIASVESATSATLVRTAITTATGATLNIYTRVSDVRIVGGVWDRLNGDGTGSKKHAICLRRVDGLRVSDLICRSTGGGKYAVNVGDVSDYTLERISANPGVQADLVHINGPAYRGLVQKISGTPHDDLVGVTAMDFADYSDVSGPVVDLDVVDLSGDPSGAAILKMTASAEQGAYLSRIRARNLSYAGSNSAFTAVNLKSDCGTLDARDIVLDNVQGRVLMDGGNITALTVRAPHLAPTTNSFALVTVTGTNVKTMTLEAVTNTLTASSVGALVRVENNVGSNGVASGGGKIGTLNLTDINWESNAAYLIELNNATAQITTLKATNVRHYSSAAGGGGLISANVAGAVLGDVYLSNVEATTTAWVGDLATATRVWLSGVRAAGLFRVRATGALIVRGSGIELTNTNLTVDAGGTLRSVALDLPADVSKLTKTAGDRATNTNATLSCGAGPVISDGTSWKNLFTGATY